LKGPTHFAFGAATGAMLVIGTQSAHGPTAYATIVAGALISGVGALAPDIDHPTSTVSRGVPRALMAQAVRLFLPFAALIALSAYLGDRARLLDLASAMLPLMRLAVAIAVAAAALLALSVVVRAAFGHRGATHSLVFAAVAAATAMLVCSWLGVRETYGLAFGGGWLSHLIADAGTRKGLPALLWPFTARR